MQDKVRTAQRAYKIGIDCVTRDIDPQDYDWMIIHADNEKLCDELRTQLQEATGRPVDKRVFRSVIMSHTGEGKIREAVEDRQLF